MIKTTQKLYLIHKNLILISIPNIRLTAHIFPVLEKGQLVVHTTIYNCNFLDLKVQGHG